MHRSKTALLLGAMGLLLTGTVPAWSQCTTYGSEASFLEALEAATTRETFDGFDSGTEINDQIDDLIVSSFGSTPFVLSSPAAQSSPNVLTGGFPGFSEVPLPQMLDLDFVTSLTAFGLYPKHWHGASPQASMTHIAITEHRGGSRVEWLEHVSDEQYAAALPGQAQAAAQPHGSAELRAQSSGSQQGARPSGERQQKFAPGLAALTDEVLFGDVWRRAELSPRDRSLVTVAVLIATGKPAQLTGHLGRALDNGVLPSEASGLLAHLAIYCGWPSAVSALEVYEQVYTARRVDTAALQAASPRLQAPAADSARASAVAGELGAVAPKFVELTNQVVFDDLWRRSDLTTRDRSLVTLAALAALGDDDQLDPYLRGALETGLTRAQIGEAFTHLGFYAGWAKATKAIQALARTPGR